MIVGTDEAWATSHHNPYLRVRMAYNLRTTPGISFEHPSEDDETGTLIAVWYYNPKESYGLTLTDAPAELWLYKGKYQLKNIRFHHRDTLSKYVVASEDNKRFDIINAQRGEHYIINAKGDLEGWYDGSKRSTFLRQ